MKPAIPPAMGVGSWRLAAGRRKDINMPSSRCGRAAWVPGRRKARPQGGNKHLVARPRDHGGTSRSKPRKRFGRLVAHTRAGGRVLNFEDSQ